MTQTWRDRLVPEQRLLLACSRIELDQARRNEICELVAGPFDWTQFLRLAERHGIPNLVFHHLRDLDIRARVPAPIWTRF